MINTINTQQGITFVCHTGHYSLKDSTTLYRIHQDLKEGDDLDLFPIVESREHTQPIDTENEFDRAIGF